MTKTKNGPKGPLFFRHICSKRYAKIIFMRKINFEEHLKNKEKLSAITYSIRSHRKGRLHGKQGKPDPSRFIFAKLALINKKRLIADGYLVEVVPSKKYILNIWKKT